MMIACKQIKNCTNAEIAQQLVFQEPLPIYEIFSNSDKSKEKACS